MNINPINSPADQSPGVKRKSSSTPQPPDNPVSIQDQITLSGEKGERLPKLIVGAPTGRLHPYIDEPNIHPSPIAIEIVNGVGIGIDGESIVVAPGREGEIEVIGHLSDGTYPQRDYKVTRKGNQTKVDGYYDWQDYTLTQNGNKLHIAGETPRETYDVFHQDNKITIQGKYPVQNYDIQFKGNQINVDGFEELDDAQLITQGNITNIKGSFEERNFTITREPNRMKVDGRYAYQDFDITWNDREIVIKGCYPHQTHTIRFKKG